MSPKHAKKVKRVKYHKILLASLLIVSIIGGIKIYLNMHSREVKQDEITSPTDNQNVQSIDEILNTMTLEEKVAQMIMARVPETNAVDIMRTYQFGGYTLFGNDFQGKTKEQIIEENKQYQDISKIPVLIGVDEEGGTVNRASLYLRDTPFASPQELYALGGYEAIITDTKEKDSFLKALGINVNFAPVVDVSSDPEDYMYPRTFGKPAKETAEYATEVVSTMKKDQMGSVAKHFPGYGNNVNTHTEVAYDTRGYEVFEQADFLPFEAATKAGIDGILVSHNIVECMDSRYPASLSPKVHEILRETIDFHGVIITDDLIMNGVSEFGDSGDIAVQAVIAGNDMLFSSDPVTQYQAVLEAVKEGFISVEQIDTSVKRILEWKQNIGILS